MGHQAQDSDELTGVRESSEGGGEKTGEGLRERLWSAGACSRLPKRRQAAAPNWIPNRSPTAQLQHNKIAPRLSVLHLVTHLLRLNPRQGLR